MLILFDIDGTLLTTNGAGREALVEAGRELFGNQFTIEGVEIAGRLDPLIFSDAAAKNGVPEPDQHHQQFRDAYGRRLERRFETGDESNLLPGVSALVEALTATESVALGVLTGNYPETGRMKIRRAGLDPDRFKINAWGSDGAHRRDLPPVAMERYQESHGRRLDPDRVLIIGDTPHDVDCAHANGCRCLAVATGRFEAATLAKCGPDLVVDDLSQTSVLLDWVLPAPRTT